jgi:hypothetical protein
MCLKSIPGAVQICILFTEYNPVLINYSTISMRKYTSVHTGTFEKYTYLVYYL